MNAIPGTSFNYKCSTGFGVADESNPDQVLSCTANFKVEGLDAIQICEGKTRKDKKLSATYHISALECPVPTINTATTKTNYNATDAAGRVTNRTYTLECLDGYTMLTEPDKTFSDAAICTLDATVPSVSWLYNNTQDQPQECEGNRMFVQKLKI